MPTLKKLLSRFSLEDRIILEFLIAKIVSLDWHTLDIKKLKGRNDFRLRVGDYRIIFSIEQEGIQILKVGHRKNIYD